MHSEHSLHAAVSMQNRSKCCGRRRWGETRGCCGRCSGCHCFLCQEPLLVLPAAFVVFVPLLVCSSINASWFRVEMEDGFTCQTCIYGMIEVVASSYSFLVVLGTLLFEGWLVIILGIGALSCRILQHDGWDSPTDFIPLLQ
ncbi:hypothetical protein Pelo_8232 [Pelomyxa schiedti]|nr:hypothetical protein Pelo_8232 [Pelomyxa schiedti]